MAKFTQIITVSAAVVLAALATQALGDSKQDQSPIRTCDCEIEVGVCEFAFETSPGFCKTDSSPCEKCVCVAGGQMTCVVTTGQLLVITNPLNGQCEISKTFYAECPRTPLPTPLPTPTPTAAPNGARPGWYLSAAGESCDSICTFNGASCDANVIADLNSNTVASPAFMSNFMLTQFGYTCPATPADCTLGSCPLVLPGIVADVAGSCQYSSTQTVPDCAATNVKVQRVCCCGGPAFCPL